MTGFLKRYDPLRLLVYSRLLSTRTAMIKGAHIGKWGRQGRVLCSWLGTKFLFTSQTRETAAEVGLEQAGRSVWPLFSTFREIARRCPRTTLQSGTKLASADVHRI